MVATDTIVGIVGAALLVAVMAGVFVYEVNNAPEDGDSPDAAMAHFEEDYPGLSALDDIDGDGTPNYLDDDLDGDGVPNDEDDDVKTTTTMSGSLGAQVGPVIAPSLNHEFYVGHGTMHVKATVVTSLAAPNPLLSGNFVMELLRPDGSVAANAASSPGGPGTFTLQTQDGDEVPVGNWTVRVTQNQAGPGGNFDITTEVHYAGAAEPHDH
jgi:hypothetical protein